MHDPIHTTECEVIYTHAYVHADISNTNTRACLARIPTLIRGHNAIAHSTHKCIHSCEQSYVLYSLECLECGVVGKYCSNVLRSLHAYRFSTKPACACGREKNDTAHVRSSRCVHNRVRTFMQAARNTSVRHSAEAYEEIALGYT
jgi:hypothetical protein